MKSLDGGSTRRPENRLTARSKVPHQALTGVDRPRYGARIAARVRAACGRGCEVDGDRHWVVRGVVEVLVEGGRPRRLLWPGINLHLAGEVADRLQQFPGDVGDGSVGSQRHTACPSVAVFGNSVVSLEIEGNDQRTGPVRGLGAAGSPSHGR